MGGRGWSVNVPRKFVKTEGIATPLLSIMLVRLWSYFVGAGTIIQRFESSMCRVIPTGFIRRSKMFLFVGMYCISMFSFWLCYLVSVSFRLLVGADILLMNCPYKRRRAGKVFYLGY